MSTPLSWMFRLFDGMSGPAGKMSSALDKTTGSLDKATKATGKLNDSSKSGAAGVEGLFGKLAIGGAVVAGAAALVEGLVSRLVDLSRGFLDTAATAEKLGLAFTLNLGSVGGAELTDWLRKIGNETGYTTTDLQRMVNPLVQMGVSLRDIQRFTPAAMDAIARTGDEGAFSRTIQALGTARTRRTIDLGTLESLGVVGEDRQMAVLKDLNKKLLGSRALGLSSGLTTPTELLGFLSERMQRKRVNPDDAINLLLKASVGQSGALGDNAMKRAEGLEVLLRKVSNIPTTWMETLADPTKLGPVKDVLNKIVDTFSPASAGGQQLLGVVTSLVDGFLNLTRWVAKNWETIALWGKVLAVSLGTVAGIITLLLGIIGGAIALVGIVIASVVYQIYDFFRGLGMLGEYIGDALGSATARAADWLQGLIDWFPNAASQMGKKAVEIGTAIWQGIKNGITAGIGAVTDAISNLGEEAVGGLKKLLGIASPSKVFRQMGHFSAMGFAEGIMGGGALVDQALGNTFGVDSSGSPMGSGSSGQAVRAGGGISVGSISLTVHVDGNSQDPQRLAERIKEIVPGAVIHAIEQLAVQQGGF